MIKLKSELSNLNHTRLKEPITKYIYAEKGVNYEALEYYAFIESFEKNLHVKNDNLVFVCTKRGSFVNEKYTTPIKTKWWYIYFTVKVKLLNMLKKAVFKVFKKQILKPNKETNV